MVCGNFILPEPASYVFFYAIFNLRKLLYIIYYYDDSCRFYSSNQECQYYFFARRYIYHKSCSLQWLSFIGNSLWSKSRRILRELENNCNF